MDPNKARDIAKVIAILGSQTEQQADEFLIELRDEQGEAPELDAMKASDHVKTSSKRRKRHRGQGWS